MWFRVYKDKPIDRPFRAPDTKLEGCRMREINGWGDSYHTRRPRKPSLLKKILYSLFNW